MTAHCDCVVDHNPNVLHTHRHHIWPLGMGGPDISDPDPEVNNVVDVCPNTHASTHQLIRLWGARYDGEPPWWVRRRFPETARRLAETGWRRWDDAGRPVDAYRWIWQGAPIAVDTLAVAHLARAGAFRGSSARRWRTLR